MRIGALPRHPNGELGHAFNWSVAGVVNGYINNADIFTIENGERFPFYKVKK